jgi:phospholipase/lecithinase/hemolysin
MHSFHRGPNRAWFVSSLLIALASLGSCDFLAGNAEAAPFTDLISFGDSLSDVGNVAGITKPGIAPLVNGYYQQTHFSDNVI